MEEAVLDLSDKENETFTGFICSGNRPSIGAFWKKALERWSSDRGLPPSCRANLSRNEQSAGVMLGFGPIDIANRADCEGKIRTDMEKVFSDQASYSFGGPVCIPMP